MLTPQVESTSTLSRNHKAVFNKLINGPVYIATHSKANAVLLSIPDYEKLLADSEDAKRFRRIVQYDQDFAEMNAGNYTNLNDLAGDNANSSQ